jgi:FtsH-binding integral membrane protein
MVRVMRVATLVLVAVVVAVAGAFVHAATARIGPFPLPYGLVLALLGLAALLWLAHAAARTRLGTVLVAAGWLLPVVVLAQGRAAGDVVIQGDVRGLAFLLAGVVFIGVALGVPVKRRLSDAGGDCGRLG